MQLTREQLFVLLTELSEQLEPKELKQIQEASDIPDDWDKFNQEAIERIENIKNKRKPYFIYETQTYDSDQQYGILLSPKESKTSGLPIVNLTAEECSLFSKGCRELQKAYNDDDFNIVKESDDLYLHPVYIQLLEVRYSSEMDVEKIIDFGKKAEERLIYEKENAKEIKEKRKKEAQLKKLEREQKKWQEEAEKEKQLFEQLKAKYLGEKIVD